VDDDVAKTSEIVPGEGWVQSPQLAAELLDGLADDFEVADRGILEEPVGEEGLAPSRAEGGRLLPDPSQWAGLCEDAVGEERVKRARMIRTRAAWSHHGRGRSGGSRLAAP